MAVLNPFLCCDFVNICKNKKQIPKVCKKNAVKKCITSFKEHKNFNNGFNKTNLIYLCGVHNCIQKIHNGLVKKNPGQH